MLPLVKQGISTGSLAVKSLSAITNFVISHRRALITLTATVAAYVAGVKLSVLWNKRAVATEKMLVIWHAIQDKWLMTIMLRHAVLNGAMSKTVALQKMLNIVIGANPLGAFLAVITAVTTALVLYRQKLDDAAIAQNKINDIKKEAAAKSAEEETHIRTLIDAAKDETLSMDERRKAVNKLNQIIPNYNAQLDTTTGKYKASKKALDGYLQSLQRKYELEGAKDELKRIGSEIAKERVNLRKATEDLKKAQDRSRKANNSAVYMPTTWQAGIGIATSTLSEERAVSDSNEKLRKLYAERKGITEVYGSDLEKDAANSNSNSTSTTQSGSGGDSETNSSSHESTKPDPEVERQKLVQKELDSITADYETKRTQAKQAYLDGTIATQEDYNRKVEDLEIEELNKKLEVAGLEPKKRAEIEKKILDYNVKLYDQLREIEQSFGDTEAEQLARELDNIKQKYDHDLALLNNLHDKKLISEEQYQADLKRLYERYTTDTDKANKESADRYISDAKATFESLMELQRQSNIKSGNIEEQSQAERSEAWKGYLQKLLEDTALTGEQRLAIQQQIDDADIEQTKDALKQKQDLAQKYNDIVCSVIVSAGQKLGEELGKILQGEKADFKDFLRGMLSLMIDALENVVVTMRAASIARNVGTLGPAGLAKAAIETALVKAAFEMAKAAVGSFDVGGFTPTGPWDKPQGIVHSNEFVANRFATGNPNVLPVLNLIDEAQRSGSVSRLSPDDIAAVIPQQRHFGGATSSAHGSFVQHSQVLQPTTDAALTAVLSRVVRSLNSLDRRFAAPIVAETYATGKHGTIEAERLVDKMKSNVSRKRK